MRKINCLLDSLRDEDGVINPTGYRLMDGGRSLVYNANCEPRLPIQFVVVSLPLERRLSIIFPHKRLDDLSAIEFEYVFQTIMASPYRSRCEVEDTYDRTTRTSTVTIRESQDVMTSIQHDRLCAEEWFSIGTKDTVDLWPGGVYWKQRGEMLMAEREQKRRVRQLRRIGLVAHLRALGIGTWGFALDFEHHIQTNTYTIKVENCGPSRCTSTAERSKLYEGDDRTLFLRVFADAITNYRAQAIDLRCHVYNYRDEEQPWVAMSVKCRRDSRNKIEWGEPIASWLTEAAHTNAQGAVNE